MPNYNFCNATNSTKNCSKIANIANYTTTTDFVYHPSTTDAAITIGKSLRDELTDRINQGIIDNLVNNIKWRYDIFERISNEELIAECQKRGLLKNTMQDIKLPSLALHTKYRFLI